MPVAEVLLIGGLAVLGAVLGATAVPAWASANLRGEARLGVLARILATAATALAFGLLGWRIGLDWLLPAMLALAVVGVAVSAVDLLEQRIPNRMLLTGSPVVALLLLAGLALHGAWLAMLWALAGAAAMFALYLLLALLAPNSMGMGDVKLAALLGGVLGALGLTPWLLGLMGAFLIGGVAAVVSLIAGRAGWRSNIPFGPWMVAGAISAIVVTGPSALA